MQTLMATTTLKSMPGQLLGKIIFICSQSNSVCINLFTHLHYLNSLTLPQLTYLTFTQIDADLEPMNAANLLTQKIDLEKPGEGQHYCLHCG